MHPRRKTIVAALALGLTLGLGNSVAPAVAAGSPTAGLPTAGLPIAGLPTAGSPAARTHAVTVTLLTGDRVTTTGTTGQAVVTPAKGREHVRFAVATVKGHLTVIPQDALRLVGTGTLDRRLFDVTLLESLGYDDAHASGLPLIVSYPPASGAALAAPALGSAGTTITRDLPAIHGAAIRTGKDRAALWPALVRAPGTAKATLATGIAHVWLDGRRQPALDHSVPQIGAPTAWAAGYTGAGVSVAVLDTGIDATHPDLTGKVVAEQNFSADPDPSDTVGHGTHVASIIAGTGAASGGLYRGVAPDATLYDGKVCESFGCEESAILAGMQWAAADNHARVVNVSLGGGDTPDIDPLEAAVNSLTATYGTLFVIAAGNAGPDDGTVGSPGSADAALTVGAVDRDDQLAYFSSRGPRVGDDAMKPDITAPGVDIVAARGAGTQLGEPVGDSYVRLSGTSMATPHVVGSAALLAQQHPQWTAGQLKADLMASAKPNPTVTGYQQGAGRVDVARAITEPVTSDPVSLSLGRQSWPHTDDTPVVRTLTYHNSGGTELNLTLTAAITGPGGTPAPAGMFAFSANPVTVPAGGSAQVTVTTDTRIAGPDGLYSGQLLATDGTVQASTPIGINKEVESYTLTLSHVDRTGAAATDYFTSLFDLAARGFHDLYDPSGTVSARLPKGRYDLSSVVFSPGNGPFGSLTLLSQPVLDLTGDTALTLDARTAGGVSVTTPDANALPVLVEVGYDYTFAGGGLGLGMLADSPDNLYLGSLGAAVPGTDYVAHVNTQWATPGPDGTLRNSPTTYFLTAFQYGRMYNGFQRHYRKGELAKVQARYAAVLPGYEAMTLAFPLIPHSFSTAATGLELSLPLRRTEFYNTDPGLRWDREAGTGVPNQYGFLDFDTFLYADPKSFRAGGTVEERWNEGPFGPSFPAGNGSPYLVRFGDNIFVGLPLFGDRAGHAGGSRTDTGSTTLYLDGQVVGESPEAGYGYFPVPAATGTYQLVVTANRSGFTDLSTSIRTVWTFRSGHVPDTSFVAVPAFATVVTPELAANAAPAGERFEIPVAVQYQPGTPARSIRSMAVAVSYDDGRTWQPAQVRRDSTGWTATVSHPRTGSYVSVRITATDSAGTSVEQTLIHAYRLTAH